MFIKQFREQQVRVQDPLRPGRRVFETRLNPTGCHTVSHAASPDPIYGDEDGWIEVPDEVGQELVRFRGPRGEKFYTPDEVGEEVAAGRIQATDADLQPGERQRLEELAANGGSAAVEPPVKAVKATAASKKAPAS